MQRQSLAGSVLISLALVAGVASAQNEPPIRLPLGLKGSQAVRFGFQEVEILTNQAATLRNNEATNQYVTEAQARFRVLEAPSSNDANVFRVEMVYERVRFCMDSPIVKEPPCFDTAAPVEEALENLLAPALLAVVNKPLILRLDGSGRIMNVEPPQVDIPDVKYHGVAELMLSPAWVIARFQPVFSLSAPGPDVPASVWDVGGEMPLAHGVLQNVRVNTMHVLGATRANIVNVVMQSKAEILPFDGADPLNPQDFKFSGSGTATWNLAEGVLASRSMKHEWSFNALPRPDLPTHVESSVHTVLMRLKD